MYSPDIREDLLQVGVHLTTDQEKSVGSILGGQDVLAVMPTGAGKSMIFQSIAHSLAKRSSEEIVLIVTPLNSISFLHVRTLEKVRPSKKRISNQLHNGDQFDALMMLSLCNFSTILDIP